MCRVGGVGAAYTPEHGRTIRQSQQLSLSETLIAELEEADEYIIGAPMHNFGVPSALKLWIDQICHVGRTFGYADGKPKGLLLGKKPSSSSRQVASTTRKRLWLRSIT